LNKEKKMDALLMKAIEEVRKYSETDKDIVDAVVQMGWGRREIRSMLARMKRSPFWNVTKLN
jgi:hypothetical protein